MVPPLEEDVERTIRVRCQLLLEDAAAELEVAGGAADEVGEEKVVAEQDERGDELPHAALVVEDPHDLAETGILE